MKVEKYRIGIICAVILVLCFLGTASAETWHVDDNGGMNFTRIQDAINTASAGDRILVYSDVYYENVVVNKSVTLEGIDHPVVDASNRGSAITLCVDGITLEGFTATNAGTSWRDAGIKVNSSNNSITSNTACNSDDGIALRSSSSNNNITGNNIGNNNDDGIFLDSSGNNTLTGNTASNNDNGILLDSASNNTITGNNIENNKDEGICLIYSNNNILYLNNFINNADNVYVRFSKENIWNSKEKVNYTYKGETYTNYMGNYWDDYTGSDAHSDGIGDDDPYNIDSDKDDYPLMEKFDNYKLALLS